jgi:opacity protein-like surface antigen
MHKLPLAAATAALLLSAASAMAAETRTLETTTFTGIEITSGIDAVITVGGPQSVVAVAPSANDFNDFKYEVRDGVLHVWYDWNILRLFDFTDHNMKVTISVPALDTLASTSGSTVDASGISGDHLKLDVTTGASAKVVDMSVKAYDLSVTTGSHLTIAGTCESMHAEVTTGANADAKDLACRDLVAEATTGASFVITASGTIDGETTTGASITVYGNPTVNHLEANTGGSINFPN